MMEEEKEGLDIMKLIIPAVLYMLFVLVGSDMITVETVTIKSWSVKVRRSFAFLDLKR
jgi:hypothetical protein